jgi:hypothetical protein
VTWSAEARASLLPLGNQDTTFEHSPAEPDWNGTVKAVHKFVSCWEEPVALVVWSQGAAQEVARPAGDRVTCADLLATYGRQNEVDHIMQQCWDLLADGPDDLDCLGLAMGFVERHSSDAASRR